MGYDKEKDECHWLQQTADRRRHRLSCFARAVGSHPRARSTPISGGMFEACRPAVFTCTSVQRELALGGPGSGLRPGRKRPLRQLPL
jgi:hypothetical protein